jgi:hypothetical protein
MSLQEFDFLPGDVICRDRMGIPLVVTAVGAKRFLYIRICISARDEHAGTKSHYQNPFRKWDPSRWPDKHYAYVTEGKFDQWSILKGIKINFPLLKSSEGDKSL